MTWESLLFETSTYKLFVSLENAQVEYVLTSIDKSPIPGDISF